MNKGRDSLSLKEAIKGIEPEQTLKAIENGIENVFGSGSGALVFKALKLIYNLDKEAIPINIERFEESLEKIFGVSVAKILRKHILSELEGFRGRS